MYYRIDKDENLVLPFANIIVFDIDYIHYILLIRVGPCVVDLKALVSIPIILVK